MQTVITATLAIRCGVGDIFAAIRPLDRIALGFHHLDEHILVTSIPHAFVNGIDEPHFPAPATNSGVIFPGGHGLGTLLLRLANRQPVLQTQGIGFLTKLLYCRGCLVQFLACFKADRVDNKMGVDVVAVYMGADQHLKLLVMLSQL